MASVIVTGVLPIADVVWVLVVVTARVAPTVLMALLVAGSFSLRQQLEAMIHDSRRGRSGTPGGGHCGNWAQWPRK